MECFEEIVNVQKCQSIMSGWFLNTLLVCKSPVITRRWSSTFKTFLRTALLLNYQERVSLCSSFDITFLSVNTFPCQSSCTLNSQSFCFVFEQLRRTFSTAIQYNQCHQRGLLKGTLYQEFGFEYLKRDSNTDVFL